MTVFLQCDFVNVKVIDDESKEHRTDIETNGTNRIESISANSFEAVVFCLLLEYLPIARLRYNVCQKAFKVLKNRGLLIIVTPDSSHQGKNLDQVQLE